jgi:hypothetical protein
VQIWNEAYSRVCGDKHPREFGMNVREMIGAALEIVRGGADAKGLALNCRVPTTSRSA